MIGREKQPGEKEKEMSRGGLGKRIRRKFVSILLFL
jgi:hypothetical protein